MLRLPLLPRGWCKWWQLYCCFCLRFAAASSAIQLNCLYVNQRWKRATENAKIKQRAVGLVGRWVGAFMDGFGGSTWALPLKVHWGDACGWQKKGDRYNNTVALQQITLLHENVKVDELSSTESIWRGGISIRPNNKAITKPSRATIEPATTLNQTEVAWKPLYPLSNLFTQNELLEYWFTWTCHYGTV